MKDNSWSMGMVSCWRRIRQTIIKKARLVRMRRTIKMSERLSPEYLVSLGQQFGTPLYVYHAEKIKEQYNKLTTAFHRSKPVFFYACKALTNINILKYVYGLGA